MTTHKLGWRRDRLDRRDVHYASRRLAAPELPEAVDLASSPCMPPVFDQGALGSCVDNAWGALLSFVEAKEGNGQEIFSRLFMYWNAREDKLADDGSTLRDCIKGVAKSGVCLESVWPYDIAKFTLRPPDEAWSEGQHRAEGLVYASLQTPHDLMNCLASGYPFVFGVALFGRDGTPTLDELTAGNPVLPLPNMGDEEQGGHALTAVGYDRTKKLYKIRNSWGASFCQQGHFYLPFDYAHSQLASDFWTAYKMVK